MAEVIALLKPAPLKIKKDGDPEHLVKKFNEYMERFELFLLTTEVGGVHTAGHVAEAGGGQCKGCAKSKAMLQLVGGEEMMTLFKHTGTVEDADSYTAAVAKIRTGIKGQTNQTSARFKLFQQMPQAGQPFGRWYPRIKEQADRVEWTGYDAKGAARDAILFQTDDKKLMKKMMAEDITFDETVKAGLAYEQGAKKVDEIRGNGITGLLDRDTDRDTGVEPRTDNPEPRTRIQDPSLLLTDTVISRPDRNTRNPEPRTQNPEPRTQNPEPRTQNPEPRTRNPGPSRADRITRFTCDRCQKHDYRHLKHLRDHIRGKHEEGVRYECDRCRYKASKKSHLNEHKKAQHEGQIKPKKFRCDQCDYRVSQKGNLKRHKLAIHQRVLYYCDRCDSSFKYNDTLFEHKRLKSH